MACAEEGQIRTAVTPWLRQTWPGARIVHELPLRYSARRIDMAAICRDRIIAVEIKSSRDVLDRLKDQVTAFLPISDRVIVVTASSHYEQAFHIIATKPNIRCIEWRNDGSIDWYLANSCNIIPGIPDAAKMLGMLWRSELLSISIGAGVGVSDRAPHRELVVALWRALRGPEIVSAVCAQLRGRAAFGRLSDLPVTG